MRTRTGSPNARARLAMRLTCSSERRFITALGVCAYRNTEGWGCAHVLGLEPALLLTSAPTTPRGVSKADTTPAGERTDAPHADSDYGWRGIHRVAPGR